MIFCRKNLCLTVLLALFTTVFFSCKTPNVKVIQFDARPIYPGRSEQNKYTSYTLKLVNHEKKITTSSIQIRLNKDFIINPVLLNNSRGDLYVEKDTVLLTFSVQNKFDPNHQFRLLYNNTKTTKSKKIKNLNIKQNNPPIN